jgi:hypothetical protein
MRNFLTAVSRLRFKIRDRTAQKADACHLSLGEVSPCVIFTGKSQRHYPEKGWRLLDRISRKIPTANTDDMHDMEFDEDVLERIDFLACLFGTGKTE